MAVDLIKTALRVLSNYTAHTEPVPEDVRVLRQAVSDPEAQWEPDSLASYIVERELKHKNRTTAG